jgi:uncharacterized protein (DUF1800 family)
MYDRRSFFSLLTSGSSIRVSADDLSANDTDIENSPTPIPRPDEIMGAEPKTSPLTRAEVFHLLRRMTFAPTLTLVNQLIGKTPSEAVDILLGNPDSETPPAKPGAPNSWTDIAQENPENVDIVTRNGIEGTWRNNFGNLQNWWVDLMRTEQIPAREKLTLFWSGHFTTEFTYDLGLIPPQVLYRQNVLFRKDRIANFKTFVEDITVDAAMLEYLGGTLNVKGKPNENYGRELMELFTCGIGWYTEGDVKEAARVLTGWKSALFSDSPAPNGIFNSYFLAGDHDIQSKQFMGETIPARDIDTNTEFLVRTQEIRKLIGILFEQRKTQIAQFMMRKLYRYFVYSNPSALDTTFINEIGTIFINNDFELRPAIKAILVSKHFYDSTNVGVQIKTPAEYVAGLGRQLGVAITGANSAMPGMEQVLIDPPNVSGWDGYRTWMSTKTFPNRTSFAAGIIKSMTDAQCQTFIRQFPDFTDVNKFMTAVEEFFLPRPVSAKRHTAYVNLLLGGSPDYEWAGIVNDTATGSARLRSLLSVLVKAPDFHLC